VGAFYNKNFVNYKIEAEHGEGPGLARQWQIEGYPSFLFLNYKGEIVSRGIGYMPPSDFLGAGKEALQTYAQKGAN
jgi:thioredoxin-related protein